MIRMLIVDDEYYIRLGIRNAIDWQSLDVEIVGEAEDGERGLELAIELCPDLILMDIRMPFLDGLELMEKITEHKLECGIVVLSGYDEFEYARRAIKFGVLDYLLKPIDKKKLKETVQNAGIAIRNKRSLQHYQELLDKEKTTIRTQFLRDFILNKIHDPEEIKQRITSLSLPLNGTTCQSICVKLDDYSLLERQYSPEHLREQRELVPKLLSEHILLNKSSVGMLVDISLDEWAILLVHLNTATPEEKEKELRIKMSAFLKALAELSSHTVSISISHICKQPDGLPALYQDARMANKKYLPQTNSIVYPGSEQVEGIRPEIQEALQFIKIHFKEELTIQQVADSLYISPSYLMHLFKNDMGKTFHTFLTEYRMEAAKELLRKPGSRIYDIAAQVGYSDVKYFNKLFKKHTGLPPGDYIRIHYAEI